MKSEDSVFKIIASCREEFGRLLRAAIKDGLSKVDDEISSKKYIGTYYDWPTIYFGKNGLPRLSSTNFQGAKDYRSCFGSRENKILESDIESFYAFFKFVTSNEELESRFVSKKEKEDKGGFFPNMVAIYIYSTVTNAIDRYIHLYDSFEYNVNKADDIIHEIQNFIFLDTLPIDIVIPILFVNFEFESYALSDLIEVRRLTEKEHLSRYGAKSYNVSVHDTVLSSATHALVFKGWEVKNSPCSFDFDTLNYIQAYPIELINKFFASIRLVRNISTGYAQVLSFTKSWIRVSVCKANLPHVIGITTRSYPASFEDFYWNIESVPLVTESEMNRIGKIFRLLMDSKENSIDLSVRRLNQCLVRDNEEDSVLDATIALEALLSDDSNQEMTHKLAMRVGALVTLDSTFGKSPQQAFKDIKSIYAYRSAIVHGSRKLDNKRIIKLEDDKETTAHSLSTEYLRFVLRVLLENSEYRDAKLIDSALLLG
tara:strand:- start:97 stop:1548 length:1452 start_codon:yes stop_codon:yes gene_type:complete